MSEVPKKKRRRKSPKLGAGRQHAARRSTTPADDEGAELIAEFHRLLAERDPLALFEYASAMLNALDTRSSDPFDRSDPEELPPLPDLLSSFVAAGPEPATLGWALAELTDDDLVKARVRREMSILPTVLPSWLRLEPVQPVAAVQVTDPFRDNANVMVHTRVAGSDVTMVVLIDFNLGGVVKDCFVVPATLDSIAEVMADHDDAALTLVEELSAADARARIGPAVETGKITWPPPASDTWPMLRPLLQWLLRRLPDGGVDFVRPEWSERARADLADRFAASPYGAPFDQPDDASIISDLIWFRTDYGYGDPLRWSPTAVEILLLDWYPRKIVADQAYLGRMPAVLRAFVEFAHDESGLADELTAETRAAIDELETEYRSVIGSPRHQGPFALLDAMGALDDLDDGDFAALDAQLMISTRLASSYVGGPEALAVLDDEPLPDEDFDWSGLSPDLRGPLTDVLRRSEAACATYFDLEHRTAVRRLLHDVALAKPRAFRGRGSAETAAGAVCWLVGRANNSAGFRGGVPTKELMDHFGLAGTPAARVNTMRQAVGADQLLAPGALGSPRYLTSASRHRLMGVRDGKLSLSAL